MENKQDYHDPDYPEVSTCATTATSPKLEVDEKISKIKNIVHREFDKELEARENEFKQIDQRLSTARRLLHRLRYTLVSNYYTDQKLQLTSTQIQDEIAAQYEPRARTEVSALLRDGQRRIHPSVRKLLGKDTVDIDDLLLRTREPRNKSRKDYSAMLQSRNYTISADKTKTLRPETQTEVKVEECRPTKVPRRMDPKVDNVLTLDEITRNKMKHRYRIIIGNTSKYAPSASQADRSTHKWLLYVRGPPPRPALSALLTAVTVRLHHSYAPHHTVHLVKPPFHITRRGWGEFPAKIELHFALPERNRPATVEHTIKLDRNYTGLQTLGAETIVDVWLYSTHDMLEYEFKEDTEQPQYPDKIEEPAELIEPKPEPVDIADNNTDNWMDFFTTESTELDVDQMIIKPVKKEVCDKEVELDYNYIDRDNNLEQNNDIENEMELVNGEECIGTSDKILSMWNSSVQNVVENLPDELLNVQISPLKRIMKYMDPTTGKIYYLEMDRNLDLSKVQEIVMNSKGQIKTAKISPLKENGLKSFRKNKAVSLLKPEVKSLLKPDIVKKENQVSNRIVLSHIENDHCYLGNWTKEPDKQLNCEVSNSVKVVSVKKEFSLYDSVCAAVTKFNNVRVSVNYLLRKIPLVSDQARDPDFLHAFPFIVDNDKRYWKLDFAKRRNIEWSRARLIHKILTEHFKMAEPIWRTKQILIFARLHGYYPIRQDNMMENNGETDDWTPWNNIGGCRDEESNIKEIYPSVADISSLSIFNKQLFSSSSVELVDLADSDEEIDVVECRKVVEIKREVLPDLSNSLPMLPVENEEDRLRFLFLEKKCLDIGIELRNEDVGSGYCYSAVHAVLLSAMKNFAEEIIRAALAVRTAEDTTELPPVWAGRSSSSLNRPQVSVQHVYRAISVTSAAGRSTSADGTNASDVTASQHTPPTYIPSSSRLHILGATDLATNKKQTHSI